MSIKRLHLAVWIIFLIFLACSLSGRLEATEYTVGGTPGPTDFASLNDLFNTVTLVGGDVIVLYQDDSSLQNKTVNLPVGGTVTIKSDLGNA